METAVVLTHLGMGDMLSISPAVKYIAHRYALVYVFSKQKYLDNAIALYENTPNIKPISHGTIELNELNDIREILSRFDFQFDLFACGMYKQNRSPFEQIPDNFYRDLGLHTSIYDNWFSLPDRFYSIDNVFMNKGIDCIFLCGRSANSDITQFIKDNVSSDLLIIDPAINHYDFPDPRHAIAASYISKPIFEYVHVLQRAKEIHVIDSAFSLLAKFTGNPNAKKYLYLNSGATVSTNFFKDWEMISVR